MPDIVNAPHNPPTTQKNPPQVPKKANTTKVYKRRKSTLNKDKALAYLKEYTRNGFNKTGALHTINKNRATYKSNNVNANRFHQGTIVNESVMASFKLSDVTVESIIEDIISTREQAKRTGKASDRLRANELLGKFKQIFNDTPNIQTNIYNANDIKDLERIQAQRVKV